MAKRALIIRSDYRPLAGFSNSAACITQALRARGFEIVSCEGAAATRAEILCAYDRLTAGATEADGIVIYYVGHGGLVTNPSYTPEGALPPYIQHICPTDFAETTDRDFRGISALELSLHLAALTRKTRNATVILECCYAAQMSRGDDPPDLQQVPPTLTRTGLVSHFRALRERFPDLVDLSPRSNPDAVRVAASGQVDSAYNLMLPPVDEQHASGIDLPSGGWVGGMTLRLVQILAELGDARVTWRSIGEALRARLHLQRPEIEGPVERLPFSLDTVDAAAPSVRPEGAGAIVDAGRLLGVSVGDVYGVMPAGSTQLDPAQLIAEITIDQATAVDSRASRIDWRSGHTALPPNAVAVPRSLAFERYPVRVVADAVELPTIAAALQPSGRIRAARPDDCDSLCELSVAGGVLELRDPLGLLFPPAPYPASLPEAVRDLENLATVHRLRAMAEAQGVVSTSVSVELLVVRAADDYRPLADHGAALGIGDRIAIRLVNRTQTALFAHVFNLGLRGRITMLSDAGGIRLASQVTTYSGLARTGKLVGFDLKWPRGLPQTQARTDTVMVIVTEEAADLGALESTEHLARALAPTSPLQALFGQIARGGMRSRGDETTAFAMYWRDYQLYPLQCSLDYGAPLVDASPPGAPPPLSTAATLSVRLTRLALAPGTRVDILVCARSSTRPYTAMTLIGPALDDIVIWSGELRGAADVYVFTSPHPGEAPVLNTLGNLLASPQSAAAAALLGDPAQAALAAGASLQLAALARASLRSLSPNVATAFHSSFGADDLGSLCATPAASFAIAIERLARPVSAGSPVAGAPPAP